MRVSGRIRWNWRGKRGNPFDFARRNSLASACMWTLPLVCFACALFFWNDSAALMIAGWTFNAAYVLIYFCFVRFKIPAWAVVRAETGIPAELAQDDEADSMTSMR